MLSRLMPCMYLIHCDLGLFGSGFRKYKYSASCFKTLMINSIIKIQVYHASGSSGNKFKELD